MGVVSERRRSAGRRGLIAVVALATLVTACVATGPSAPGDTATLREVKRTVYGDQARVDAESVAAGASQPILEFTVQDTPPSIFVNWIVSDANAAAFEAAIGLPPGFSLAKVRILESDPAPQYWLSLNVYRVGGITTGLRAEWSTYVDDGSGAPRFMIIRARASDGSVDPIGPLALPEPFAHSVDANGMIHTAMNRTEIQDSVPVVTGDPLYDSTIQLPDAADRTYVTPAREWVAANDFIYWLNGVNDRIFHNSTSHSAPLISVDLADVTLDDQTEWVPFLDPQPAHVLVYLDEIQFMIGPWWNVTEPDGRVDPATRADLFELKKTMYGGLTGLSALQVQLGNEEPLVKSSVDDAPPRTYWHWRIPAASLADFESSLDLPTGLSLSTVRLEESDAAAEHWLTLAVEQVSGARSGLRAQWSTYVDDGTSTRVLTIEERADHLWLDPVTITSVLYPFTPAYPLTHTVSGATVTGPTVDTTVGEASTAFTSSLDLPAAGTATTVLASREWVGAHDLSLRTNGVGDRVFYDTSVFEPKVSIDPAEVAVTDGSQWAGFVGPAPDRVWVDQGDTDLVTNPWWNLNGL